MRHTAWGLALWLVFSLPSWAQIETANGGVTSPRSPELKTRVMLMRAQNGNRTTAEVVGTWGLDPKNELRAIVPYVFTDQLGTSQSGIGDLYVRYKHSLAQTDGVMSSNRFAVLVDATMPTGDSDNPGLPPRAQLGMGTPEIGAGLVYSIVRNRHRASAEVGYLQPLGNGFAGTGRLNVAYWYRLTPAEFPEDDLPVEVRGVVEILSELRGAEFGQDAGTLVYLAPGLQIYPSRAFQLEFNVRIPIAQSIRDQMGDRYVGGSLAAKFRF